MLKLNNILIFGIIIFKIKIATALVITNLYTSQVEVRSKDLGLEEKTNIMQQEFDRLLFKLTGKSNLTTMGDLSTYVIRYEYNDLTSALNGIWFKIYFDKNLIQTNLTIQKHPFLGEHRPATIIWPKTTSSVILLEELQELLQQITIKAKDYALAVSYPILDLKEVAMLNQDLAPAQFIDLIKSLSQRYEVDEIIIAECKLEQEQIQLDFSSLNRDAKFNFALSSSYGNSTNKNLAENAILFLDKLMEHFIDSYGSNIKGANKEVVSLRISNINDLEDYVKIEKYLQGLAIVNSLYTSGFKVGEVEFQITALGGKQAIKHILAQNKLLQEENLYNYDSNNSHNKDLLAYTFNL